MVDISRVNGFIKLTYMEVSINGGTPKSSSLIGFSIVNHPFGATSIYGNPISRRHHPVRLTYKGPRLCLAPGHTLMHEPKGPATQETSASLDRSVERSLTRNAKIHEIKCTTVFN